jgi:hypothetical protein
MFSFGRSLFFLFVFTFTSHVTFAYQQLNTALYTSDVKYDDGVSYEWLTEKMKLTKAQTLESTLELIPREFYNNYVLVYRSRSLQDASSLFPRAIVFGKSSRFIMAFNGHEKQKGFNNLEIIQFRETTHRWEFREITFSQNNLPVFSEANPKKCLECHQSPKRINVDPRPNWEPYNFWPGVYASVDDKIEPVLKPDHQKYLNGDSSQTHSTVSRFLPQDMILIEEQSHELDNLIKFEEKIKPTHNRYKYFSAFNTRGPLNITKSLVTLNMQRVARIMREELGDLFDVYKYTILGLGGAENMNSASLKFKCEELYMPESLFNAHLQEAMKKRKISEREYSRPQGHFNWQLEFATGVDIVFTALNIQTDDWSMDFRTNGRFSAVDRFTSPHDSAGHFRAAVNKVYADDPAVQLGCKELAPLAIDQMTVFENSGGFKEAVAHRKIEEIKKPIQPIIQRCIGCHVNYEDGGQAPAIPFDDFSILKPMLQENKYRRGTLYEEILYRTSDHAPLKDQMPPAGIQDRQQRDEFMETLQKVMGL